MMRIFVLCIAFICFTLMLVQCEEKGDRKAWTTYTTGDRLAIKEVIAIAIDAQGNKWFGTYGGVLKFDGANWTIYTTTNGLADNTVASIAIDAQGNKWFGTEAGVSKFSD